MIPGPESISVNVFTLFVLSVYLGAHVASVSESFSCSSVLQRLLNRTQLFSRDTNAAHFSKITGTTASYKIAGLEIDPFMVAECRHLFEWQGKMLSVG